jgi:NAD(P)-dependent dehydrogenase (short-subunit alcohol dehydrogenase family)
MSKTAPAPVWFITAAASGFGHEIAQSALQRGHKVIATARSSAKLHDLQSQGAETLDFDVSWPSAKLSSVATDAVQIYGRIDYLINAAGYILEGSLEESTAEEVQDQFNVNVFGTVNTIRAFLPHVRAQEPLAESEGGNGRRATFATFGSLASWKSGAAYTFYSMTKACMSSLAEGLSEELSPFNIGVTVIEPGYFRTGFLNPSAKKATKHEIEAYRDGSTPSGKVRGVLGQVDGNQPGDVKKGVKVLVDVLTEDKELPVRVVLGSDCIEVVREKNRRVLEDMDAWAPIGGSTDHE